MVKNRVQTRINESLVKYLAGLLDADGSLSFSFRSDQNNEDRFYIGLALRLTASDNIDHDGFVASLPDLTGMGSISRYGDSRQFVAWNVSRRADLEMLLPRLIKHMAIKAKHWQWLLEIWRECRSRDNAVSTADRERLTAESKESRRSKHGPLRPKNHPTWAWLAGYLDGDGWYIYRRQKANTGYWQWSMSVGVVAHVNDAGALEFIRNAFGGIVRDHGQSPNIKVWYRSLGYQNRSFALRFLPNVAKHSRLKRRKIDAMIHHHRQRLSVPGTERRFCTMPQCELVVHGNGLCSLHYQRQRKQVQATV